MTPVFLVLVPCVLKFVETEEYTNSYPGKLKLVPGLPISENKSCLFMRGDNCGR